MENFIKKRKSIKITLRFLNSNQGTKSRQYSELRMVQYLRSNYESMKIQTAIIFAQIQSYMIENIKCKYKGYFKLNLICNSGMLSECHQEHLFFAQNF